MAKKASLASALDNVTPLPAHPPAKPEPIEPKTLARTDREGTVLVGAHLSARVGKALKLLSAETGKKQRELLEEALEMLFVRYGSKVDK